MSRAGGVVEFTGHPAQRRAGTGRCWCGVAMNDHLSPAGQVEAEREFPSHADRHRCQFVTQDGRRCIDGRTHGTNVAHRVLPHDPAAPRTARVSLTVSVDVADWAAEYGVPATAEAVAADVAVYLRTCVQSLPVPLEPVEVTR